MLGLKIVRLLNDKTCTDVGKVLGVSRQIASHWENGTKKFPKKRALQLAEYFDVSVEVLTKEIDVDMKAILMSLLEESI